MLAASTLEHTFIAVLVIMSAASGLFAAFVVVRLVEPGGLRILWRRLVGRDR